MKPVRQQPDIRAITRLVPPEGNLVQGQSQLAIHPSLAEAAARTIAASQNHYSPAEGTRDLLAAVAAKVRLLNGVELDPAAGELLITAGGTGALVAIADTYLRGKSILLFEPYYPYHRKIAEEFGAQVELAPLECPSLALEVDAFARQCRALKLRERFPLAAVVACTPSNPTGKVMTQAELAAIASVCNELDLLCIADEVYEHYVLPPRRHISMAALPGMRQRTLTVNSFSKSWNISGWRLGYCYGPAKLIAPLAKAVNVMYVCSPTPLQHALAQVLTSDATYYERLAASFTAKLHRAQNDLSEWGFEIFDSGSAFYIWCRIPREFQDGAAFNQMLIDEGKVAGTPGAAFADSDAWDNYLRFCIAREDSVLESSLERIGQVLHHAAVRA